MWIVGTLGYAMIVTFVKELLSVLTNGIQVGINAYLPFNLTFCNGQPFCQLIDEYFHPTPPDAFVNCYFISTRQMQSVYMVDK